MSEAKVKDAAVVYELAPLHLEAIKLPEELVWLHWLTPHEQHAFLQAILEILVRTWRNSDIVLLRQEIERWQQQAQERRAATVQAERQTLWARHEARLSQQRALIDELLQVTAGDVDTALSVAEIRAMLGQYIPFTNKLSDEIIAVRYEES